MGNMINWINRLILIGYIGLILVSRSLAKVNNVVLINCTSRPIYGVGK